MCTVTKKNERESNGGPYQIKTGKDMRESEKEEKRRQSYPYSAFFTAFFTVSAHRNLNDLTTLRYHGELRKNHVSCHDVQG